jgi:hypothetical protein
MATKSRLFPVWTKFNYIAHRNLNNGHELRQCLVSKVVGLFANLSSHLHFSWRQITHFGIDLFAHLSLIFLSLLN